MPGLRSASGAAEPAEAQVVYHVELRQFPGLARAFNLSAGEIEARILTPWAARSEVELDGRRFTPGKAKLTILEGPVLAPEQIGVGRGWGNANRSGCERTKELLAAASTPLDRAAAELKDVILSKARAGGLALPELPALLAQRHPGWRVSDRLALAERAVWELLHERRLELMSGARPLEAEEWERTLLDLATWTAYATTSSSIVARSLSDANR